MLVVADAAEQAGALLGRLVLPLVGVLLVVLGTRRRNAARRSPQPGSPGRALIVTGWVVVVLGVLGALAAGTAADA